MSPTGTKKVVARQPRRAPLAPANHHSVTPWLTVDGADAFLAFCKNVFRSKVTRRMKGPNGATSNAAFLVGNSLLSVADESAGMGGASPKRLGGVSVTLYVYVEQVDRVFARAVEAGATVRSQPADMFWGDRMGSFTDPFGHVWSVATHVEHVSPQEMNKRMRAFAKAKA